MVDCKAARRLLTRTEQDRNDAQLREAMEWEKARYDVRHFYHGMYDWADLRKATRNVQC